MRLPRMTTRRWMVAVAVVGRACTVTVTDVERSRRFARIAYHHHIFFVEAPAPLCRAPRSFSEVLVRISTHPNRRLEELLADQCKKPR
jgi:hypothetical protein